MWISIRTLEGKHLAARIEVRLDAVNADGVIPQIVRICLDASYPIGHTNYETIKMNDNVDRSQVSSTQFGSSIVHTVGSAQS